jgi:hypothetical protein
MVFAACMTSDPVRVPVEVTGLPDTEKIEGSDNATLVTPVFEIVMDPAPFVMDVPVPAVSVVATGTPAFPT